MSYTNSPRNFILCQIAFMVVITFLLSPQQRTGAHIFGLISGIFLGFCLCERFEGQNSLTVDLSPHERTIKNLGIGLTIGMAAVFITLTMFIK